MAYGLGFDVAGSIGERLRKALRISKQLDLRLLQNITPVIDLLGIVDELDVVNLPVAAQVFAAGSGNWIAYQNNEQCDLLVRNFRFMSDSTAVTRFDLGKSSSAEFAPVTDVDLRYNVVDGYDSTIYGEAAQNMRWEFTHPIKIPAGFLFVFRCNEADEDVQTTKLSLLCSRVPSKNDQYNKVTGPFEE